MRVNLFRTAAAMIAAAVLFCMPAQADLAVSADYGVLLDAASGRVLWEKGARERALVASTTKIMTGLLIAEDCDLEEEVHVPEEAVGIEGSSMYLRAGDILSVEALLYGMMLQSGNDAAAALAIHHSGNIAAFAEAMNRKAAMLGLHDTHFVNPHGLDAEEHYSTALDLAKLSAAAMEHPVFHQVVSTKNVNIEGRALKNHNRLLWQYEGAAGIKTGYTKAAGRILVGCAERDGRRLIAVTISAPDDWNDHKVLLDHGFSAYTAQTVVMPDAVYGPVPVIGGASDSVEAVPETGWGYPLAEGESVFVACTLPSFVYAPVLAGEQAGELVLFLQEKEIGRIPLYWRDTVMEEA